MLNTFPITEIKRPTYIYARAYAEGLTICSLTSNGLIAKTSSLLSVGTESPFVQDIDSDDLVVGAANGTKYSYYAPTAVRYANFGSWSTNGICPAGYSSINKRIYFFTHGGTSGKTYEYLYSPTQKTGSSTIQLTMIWPSPILQFGNNETSTYAKGKIFIGSQAGSNSTGGVIVVNRPETTSSIRLNCSGSGLTRVAGPAYDVRRNVTWSYNGTARRLVAHDFDTGVLVESRSWNSVTDNAANVVNGIYISQLDEVWVGGYSNTRVQIYNLTTNVSRSLLATDLGLPAWNGSAGGIYTLASGGGNQKIQ